MATEKWREEYLRLLFESDNSDETRTKAADLKFDHMPDRLYKYRGFNEGHISALEDGVLYAAPLDSLNDIRESNLVISEKAEELFNQRQYESLREQYGFPPAEIHHQADIIKAIEEYYRTISLQHRGTKRMPPDMLVEIQRITEKQYQASMERYRNGIRTTYSACCFSAFNNIFKMWGYYADCYNGFCIEYDFKSLGRDDLKTALLFPVIYVDDSRVMIDDIDHYDPNKGLLAATQKNREWEYEEEWRLLYTEDQAKKPQLMPKPTAIYIGDRTVLEHTQKMREYCVTAQIPLYRMKYNQRKDVLEPIPIEL